MYRLRGVHVRERELLHAVRLLCMSCYQAQRRRTLLVIHGVNCVPINCHYTAVRKSGRPANTVTATPASSSLPAGPSQTCKYPGCNRPRYYDSASGKHFEFCGRTCGRKYQSMQAMQPTVPPGKKTLSFNTLGKICGPA